MAQESQSIFQRVKDFFKPGAAEERNLAEVEAAIAEADWRDHLEDRLNDAKSDAAGFADDLRGAEPDQLARALSDVGLIPDLSAWGDPERRIASIEADARTLAEEHGFDMGTVDGQTQAYEAVAAAYVSAANEIAIANMQYEPASDSPELAHIGEWAWADGVNTEYREVVVSTDAGFHPGYETSYMGGEGQIAYSDIAFPTVAEAEAVAGTYYYAKGDETFRLELAEKGLLPDGAELISKAESGAITEDQFLDRIEDHPIWATGADEGMPISLSPKDMEEVEGHIRCAETVKEAWADIQAMPAGVERDQLEATFINSARELAPEVDEILTREAPELMEAVEATASAETAEDHSL